MLYSFETMFAVSMVIFVSQLSCPNEHVLVLRLYSQGTNWVINGPAGTLIS